jgi:hypothetical protein
MECSVATPEDTILRKLEWYRTGGENLRGNGTMFEAF